MTIGKLALVAALGMFAATIADHDRVVWADSTGVIEGLVKDKAGQLLPGVTVVVTSPALQQNQVAITDDQGHYTITGLPPGTYVVTFYYADQTVERANIVVAAGKPALVSPVLDTSHSAGEVIKIEDRVPTIDPSSTQQGVTIEEDYVQNVPPPGTAYVGATSLNNQFIVPSGSAKDNAGVEQYERIDENPFVTVASQPLSTFSSDVDTASYANVRRFLQDGKLPPADAVRIEELLNYFHYDYPAPKRGDPLSITTEVGPSPWNPAFKLVRIGLRAPEIDDARVPPRNLVFLIDTSGSMDEPNKLPLLVSSMGLLVDQLRPQDRVSIVAYAGSVGTVLAPTPGTKKDVIHAALGALDAGGSTNGGAGIVAAYKLARDSFITGGINRVILCTDGDWNVGVTDQGSLTRMIEGERDHGVFLTVLGFGMGNLKDSTMEKLADRGNGNYAYIDSLAEARKVLVKQAGATLVTVAKDVKIQVEFNPAHVAGYRLIGYEKRLLRNEDFNDDKKDAGDLGAGHTVTALYEIVPAGQPVPAAKVDTLKYQTPRAVTTSSPEMMTIKVRYKAPLGDVSKLMQRTVDDATVALATTSIDYRWAAAVAGYGMMLRDSALRGSLQWSSVRALAAGAIGKDPEGYRAEMLKLVDKASTLRRP
ncbi:MAG TPA: von Willebrand factor type A domain-containing protein [Kofleriaceae bacterium]|jgi:Ca-activated chloride channel family protein